MLSVLKLIVIITFVLVINNGVSGGTELSSSRRVVDLNMHQTQQMMIQVLKKKINKHQKKLAYYLGKLHAIQQPNQPQMMFDSVGPTHKPVILQDVIEEMITRQQKYDELKLELKARSQDELNRRGLQVQQGSFQNDSTGKLWLVDHHE